MAQDLISNDLRVSGSFFCANFYCVNPTITNSMISGSADIDATKLEHQYEIAMPLQVYGSAPTAKRQVIHRIWGTTATLVALKIGVVQAIASGTVTVDLLKNGSSILTATVTLNSTGGTGGTAFDAVAATFSSSSLVVGDVLEINLTVSSPSGGGGLYAALELREDAQ